MIPPFDFSVESSDSATLSRTTLPLHRRPPVNVQQIGRRGNKNCKRQQGREGRRKGIDNATPTRLFLLSPLLTEQIISCFPDRCQPNLSEIRQDPMEATESSQYRIQMHGNQQ